MLLIFYYFFIHIIAFGEPRSSKEEAPNFYNHILDRLDSFSKLDLSVLKGKKSLWVLFQPECKSCESQFNDLSCLKDTATVAVGFWGSRDKLNQVIRFSQFNGIKLIASKSFEEMAGLKLTPTIFLIDKDGFLKKTFLAKTPCSTLKNKMESI